MKLNNDYETIMALLGRNDYFFNSNRITKEEYIYNNLFLSTKLEYIINRSQRNIVKDFLDDNLNLSKFKLSLEVLKTAPN